jgi:uncharacterized protein YqgC (DUF456 family)
MEIFLIVASAIIILIGLAGTVLPFVPGPPLALIGLLVYAWFTDFQVVSVTGIVVFAILTLLTILFDVAAPALGAKSYKSTKYGVWGAVLGSIIGIVVLGPIGAFIGPFIGAFIGELMVQPDHGRALHSAWGAFVGMLAGTLFKLIVVISMFAYFVIVVIRHFV